MLRAHHPYPISPNAGALTLNGDESRHLLKSLRAREGEAVEVFDGKGRIWHGHAAAADKFGLRVSIVRTEERPRPAVTLTLAQCLPKGGTFDDLLRTAVELGADRIVPLTSERCEVKLTGDRAESKAERWQTLLVEGMKQSGNPWLPALAPVQALSKWLPKALGPGSIGLTASLEEGSVPIAAMSLPPETREIVVLVGPEGDLSPAEYAAARATGFRPVRLGAHVLRAETAALYALVAADQLRRRADVA